MQKTADRPEQTEAIGSKLLHFMPRRRFIEDNALDVKNLDI